jgi:hypothetical protein
MKHFNPLKFNGYYLFGVGIIIANSAHEESSVGSLIGIFIMIAGAILLSIKTD